jgi:hypothetical protein
MATPAHPRGVPPDLPGRNNAERRASVEGSRSRQGHRSNRPAAPIAKARSPKLPRTAPRGSSSVASVPCFCSSRVRVAGRMAGKARNMPPGDWSASPARFGSDDGDGRCECEAVEQVGRFDVAQSAKLASHCTMGRARSCCAVIATPRGTQPPRRAPTMHPPRARLATSGIGGRKRPR